MEETLLQFLKSISDLIERITDKQQALTELCKARGDIARNLKGMAFNPNGNDNNGVQSTYKAMKEQADKIDDLIRLILKS